ncbi:MAG: RNA 2',3'-cyclic phosphodiesterase [Oscillospiraceae bacterium]|nr:RNA 2',3'-cyclic phosphodiesterase [Oscillospiraceae bacterium]
MRLFIAILLDKNVRDGLRGMQNELRRRGVEGNYTRAENLHLTLAFIGEYPNPDAVLDAMALARFEPFALRLGGAGSFGDTWWAGLEANEELDALVRRLRRALADKGIPFDRKPFRAHVTLIRKPSFRRDPQMETLPVTETEMTVGRISLMLSTRGKNGMFYTELGSV